MATALVSVEAEMDTALDWAGTRYSEVQNGNIVNAFAICSVVNLAKHCNESSIVLFA